MEELVAQFSYKPKVADELRSKLFKFDTFLNSLFFNESSFLLVKYLYKRRIPKFSRNSR